MRCSVYIYAIYEFFYIHEILLYTIHVRLRGMAANLRFVAPICIKLRTEPPRGGIN